MSDKDTMRGKVKRKGTKEERGKNQEKKIRREYNSQGKPE